MKRTRSEPEGLPQFLPRPLQARTGPAPLQRWSSFGSVAFCQTGYRAVILQASPQAVVEKLLRPLTLAGDATARCLPALQSGHRLTVNNCCAACGAARQWQKGLLLLDPTGPPWTGCV